jgi:uncharacterized protein YndB with AHSA1/START domain
MNRTIQIAPVRKSVVVDATPAEAFDTFTAGIDRWWPKSHHIGSAPVVESVIEPRVGGRWYTKHADGTEAVVGHVSAWEPGRRFVVSWEIGGDWKPDSRISLSSEVEVRFSAEGEERTRVDLEHRNFERMGREPGEKLRNSVDNGWPAVLAQYATACGGKLS